MQENNSTIAIGGLGGSGTRLIAQLMQSHGFNIGSPLNRSLDNRLFTLLFRRPSWSHELPNEEQISLALEMFITCSTVPRNELQNSNVKKYIYDLIRSNDTSVIEQSKWLELMNDFFENPEVQKYSNNELVWKEPNTHIFLPQINNHIENFKYIHVIRNGLYMSQSKNQNQMDLWSSALDVKISEPLFSISNAFNYWYTANSRAINYGNKEMKNHFYIANYDQICKDPKNELTKIINFIGAAPDLDLINDLSKNIEHKDLQQNEKENILSQLNEEQRQDYKKLTALAHSKTLH